MATAIHAGHQVRKSLRPFMKLAPEARLREEDPFTDAFASEQDTLIRVSTSRFEVDLNRARETAVYAGPESAWGLEVWQGALPNAERAASLAIYDRFYGSFLGLLRERLEDYPRLLVLDLHSYNHRRDGPGQPPAPLEANPVVNIGTAAADREVWGDTIDAFIETMEQATFEGERLDVRENVKFTGGELSRHVARAFGSDVLTLSIEFKKVFMDEWTGVANRESIHQLRHALAAATAPLREVLNRG